MASTRLGDIPGARFHAPTIPAASIASGGGAGLLGVFGPFAHDVRVKGLFYVPTAATAVSATNASASYRRLTLVNLGTAGAGTTALATLNLTASLAQGARVEAGSYNTTHVISSGNVLAISQTTVGGALAGSTDLPAGQFAVAFEVL